MKAGRGKAKGSAFERQACKDLSLWATHQKRDDCLWRSAMSGGRSTVSTKKGKTLAHVSGDICATHPDGHPLVALFFIECKFYADLKLQQLLTSNGGKVAEFWAEAQFRAKQNHKHPMLIMKQNLLPPVLGLGEHAVSKLLPDLYNSTPLAILPQLGLHLYDYHSFLQRVPFPTAWEPAPPLNRVKLK